MREGLIPISVANCFWVISFSLSESSMSSDTEGFPIGKCLFSYDSTISDINVSSMAFLSLAGVSSVTNGKSSSILLSANSYCSFVFFHNS